MAKGGMQQIQRVYLSPKLWYLRVSIIEARDIMPGHRGSELVRFPEFSATVLVGDQFWRTGNATPSATRSFSNPYWNEEYLFVVSEPFEDDLLVSVEDRIGPEGDVVVATVLLPVATIKKLVDEKSVSSSWYNLDCHSGNAGDNHKKTSFVSQILMQISFDEGYDVLDEGIMYSRDVMPIDKRGWKPRLGVLKMGILSATLLMPEEIQDDRGGVTDVDAYCIAKYGQKWVQTRNVVDSLTPTWNEQYTWEVYDTCTVLRLLTVVAFRNNRIQTNNTGACDSQIGKVRIRLSTLEINRVYSLSYPLLMLHSSGAKKIGELQLTVRFSCGNVANMLHMYTMPLQPMIHYLHPLSVEELDRLRYQATSLVFSKLSREEPRLSKEVVEYMHDANILSLRTSETNIHRLMNTLSGPLAMLKWLEVISTWHKPQYSALCLIIFLMMVKLPEIIIPSILMYMVFLGLWNYKYRPNTPPQMDPGTYNGERVFRESDTRTNSNVVDSEWLRSVAGRFETVVGDVAVQGERLQGLLTWRDPRATSLFMMSCLVASCSLYLVPNRVVVALLGFYSLRPGFIRKIFPSGVSYFFRRLPSKADDNVSCITEVHDYGRHDKGLLIVSELEQSALARALK